jgi:A/G-specific adenine glycosylase
MDYGAYLKKQGAGQLDKSKHYKKQAPLKGSLREVRGMILKHLTNQDMTPDALRANIPYDERFHIAIDALTKEGLIDQTANRLHLRR